MRRFLLLASLVLFVSGCEMHGSWHVPPPHVDVRIGPPPPQVVVVNAPPKVIITPQHSWYEDYCIDSPYDSCCYYYQYHDLHTHWKVCEVTECYNPYTGHYQYEGMDCWYE